MSSDVVTYSMLQQALNQVDDFFRFTMASLIFFSLFGFGLFEAGISRNVMSLKLTFMKTLLTAMAAMISFWLFGYALAFGGTNVFGGGQVFWAWNQLSYTNYAHFWLQFAYAALSSTVALSSLGERCHIVTYIVFPFIWCGFVYPIVAHWVWHPSGWLAVGTPANNAMYNSTIPYTAFIDFAGSGVVLLSGGIAALVGAVLLRPRMGRFNAGKIVPYPPYSNSLILLGGSIMILGLLLFNGTGIEASNYLTNFLTLSDGNNMQIPVYYASFSIVANAFVVSVIAASTGAFTVYFLHLVIKLPVSMIEVLCGALCALASISCAAVGVQPWTGTIYGFFAGLAYKFWSWLIRRFKIDDVIDAYAIFAGGAMWGLIAAAFLVNTIGIIWAANTLSGYYLAWQLVGICAIWAWCGGCSVLIFGILRLFKVLRIKEADEYLGLENFVAPPTPKSGTTPVMPSPNYSSMTMPSPIESPYNLQRPPSVVGSVFADKPSGATLPRF